MVYTFDRYGTPSGFGVGLLAFLPQLVSLVTISLTYGEDISFALFALTMVFVIFNKVCTAQVRSSMHSSSTPRGFLNKGFTI